MSNQKDQPSTRDEQDKNGAGLATSVTDLTVPPYSIQVDGVEMKFRVFSMNDAHHYVDWLQPSRAPVDVAAHVLARQAERDVDPQDFKDLQGGRTALESAFAQWLEETQLLAPSGDADLVELVSGFQTAMDEERQKMDELAQRIAEMAPTRISTSDSALGALSQVEKLTSTPLFTARGITTPSDLIPEGLINITNLYQNLLSWRQEVGQQLGSVASMLQEWRNNSQRFVAILQDIGWPPPADIPASLVNKVARMDEAGELDRRALEATLVEYYEPNDLREMLQTWRNKPWLQDRAEILHAAVGAHIEGEYELSIPALLPQVEGLLGDAFGHSGELHGGHLKTYIKQLLQEDRPGSFRDAARHFWLKVLLENSQFDQASPQLSRHAILHGSDTQYAKESNSLRVLLLFDFVQDSIRFVATEQGQRFHKPGCTHLGPPRRNRTVYVSRHEVEEEHELTPCKVCQAA